MASREKIERVRLMLRTTLNGTHWQFEVLESCQSHNRSSTCICWGVVLDAGNVDVFQC